jgi:ASC-1-like (ASCH) protein
VSAARLYPSFEAMLAKEDHYGVVPDMSLIEVSSLLREIYPAEERIVAVTKSEPVQALQARVDFLIHSTCGIE